MKKTALSLIARFASLQFSYARWFTGTLDELKTYLNKNHHLPEIPSASQMEKEGINLSDMNMRLLKKVQAINHMKLL